MERVEDRPTDAVTDVRVGWVLKGASKVWAMPEWLKHTETKLPIDVVARTVGRMCRAQAAENAAAQDYRARLAFGLTR